ncbi:unnamed protein product [Heligmosomoides polygyrus]|uniref:Alpha-1,2-fucosyltransferase n=1 Tax=Heligmosomoides polygyrus TaxID=6339 RepID=A0A183FU81_HELPZ|nr:unnamed protein product [Heligmosomoides polygyrus]
MNKAFRHFKYFTAGLLGKFFLDDSPTFRFNSLLGFSRFRPSQFLAFLKWVELFHFWKECYMFCDGLPGILIFGDDLDFMKSFRQEIRKLRKQVLFLFQNVYVSTFPEIIDFYLSSQLCDAFLITAAPSTFGWWLAFFARNQTAVYYLQDRRPSSTIPHLQVSEQAALFVFFSVCKEGRFTINHFPLFHEVTLFSM